MQNNSQSSMGGFSEHNERFMHHAERETSPIDTAEERMLLDYLLEEGFAWDEATKLLNLREHLYENTEIRQRMTDDTHMQFARWLYEQGEISDRD